MLGSGSPKLASGRLPTPRSSRGAAGWSAVVLVAGAGVATLGPQPLDVVHQGLVRDPPGTADLDGFEGASGHQLEDPRATDRQDRTGLLRRMEKTVSYTHLTLPTKRIV